MLIAWQRRAVSDLYRVGEYIRQENPAASDRTGAAIEAAVQTLLRHPEMGRIGEVAGTRELVVTGTPYVVVYRLRGEAVQILRILHDKQKWPSS